MNDICQLIHRSQRKFHTLDVCATKKSRGNRDVPEYRFKIDNTDKNTLQYFKFGVKKE